MPQRLVLIAKNLTKISFGAGVASFLGAWWYRPLPDTIHGNNSRNGPNRLEVGTCSKNYLQDDLSVGPPLSYNVARHITIFITTTVTRFFIKSTGSFDLLKNNYYDNFVTAVQNLSEEQPMITVSNHRSLFDDPGVVSCLLPWELCVQPKYQRWGICSQEYCFSEAVPTVLHGYIGAGQVLPIWRGGGINQKLLHDFARHIASGHWCHIFPEAGVWQDEELGGRKGDTFKGKFKWGIGKLIAHAPVKPRVFLFVHHGIETLLPMNRETRKLSFGWQSLCKWWERGGHDIRVRFGEEINFDDIIEEHEKKYGKLWKYSSKKMVMNNNNKIISISNGEKEHEDDRWISSAEDKILYNKITMRVERKLSELHKKHIPVDI